MSDSIYNVLKRPVVTEKTSESRESANQYAFEVAVDANKIQIRKAVEEIFGVRVTNVQTMNMRGKVKRFRRGLGTRLE